VIIVHALTAMLFANGRIDNFYLRFTSPRQKSLIIGTSRAAQALQPKFINPILKETSFEYPIYNFSFTVGHSPFGPAYLRAIKKKLDPTTKNGVFIIAVDPWAISIKKTNINDNSLFLNEKDTFLGKMYFFNLPVNYEYLIRNYQGGWGHLVIDSFKKKPTILREDGWLEVNVHMDSVSVAKRIKAKLKTYRSRSFYLNRTYSRKRHQYLCNIIELFEKHGKVFLVRLPVSQPMKELEDNLISDFDSLMVKTSKNYNIPYYNFINDFNKYQTTDGNHLYKTSGARISLEIAKKIKLEGTKYRNSKI
jgi:hypothetical protein